MLGIAALIAIVLGAIGIAGAFFYDGGGHGNRNGRVPPPAAAAEQLPVFSSQNHIVGTQLLALTVSAQPDDDRPRVSYSGSGSENDQRNVLLLNLRDGSNRYVLPDNARQLVQWNVLSSDGPDGKTVGRAYVALVSDRGATSYDILIGAFATGQQAWVMRGVSALDSPILVDDGTIGFIVWKGNAPTYHLFGVDDLKERIARPVPILKVPPAR